MNAYSFAVRILVSSLCLGATAAVVGCSAEAQQENVASDEAAVSSCGAAKYEEARAHYENAIAWSKDRLSHEICDTDNGYQWTIADEASRAVMACSDFRAKLKSAPAAQPVRTVLADSLTLKSVTGELLVIKDSEFQNWSGVDAMLVGTQFWSPALGAYGSWNQIVFAANGKATYKFLKHDEATGDITPEQEAATYTIERPAGEKGKRTVIVTHGAVTESFTLGVEAQEGDYNSAPMFTLTPASGAKDDIGYSKVLYSLVSECDA